MRNKKGFAIFAAVLLTAGRAMAAETPKIDLARLNSANWSVRATAFEAIRAAYAPSDSATPRTLPPDVAVAVVTLLVREVHGGFKDAPAPRGPDDEGHSDFFAELIQTVAGIGTPDATAALLDPQVLGAGVTVEAIARAGHAAVAPVLARFDNGRLRNPPPNEPSAVYGWNGYIEMLVAEMGALATRPDVTPADLRQIRARLLAASVYPDPDVRKAAAKARATSGK